MKEIKVLIVTTSFPSHSSDAAGVFVLNLVKHLQEMSPCKCTVLTPSPQKDVNWPDSIDVVRFKYAPRKFRVLAQRPGGIPQALKENPLAFSLVPPFLVSMKKWILKLSRNHDIIHAHWAISGFLASIEPRMHKVPILTTLHGSDYNLSKKSPLHRFVLKHTLAKTSLVATVSQGMCNQLRKEFPSFSHKIRFLPNGVPNTFFGIKRNHKELNRVNFLYLGSLIPRKGVDVLVRALANIRDVGNWNLFVAGDGTERKRLEKMSRKNGLENKVRFLGSVSPLEVPRLMEEANCFVLPSYAEGRPTVILEAMASGLPVVATNIEGTNELVSDGENGWLFSAGDSDSLARILEDIVRSPQQLLEMGEKGRKFMLDNKLTWKDCVEKHVEIYERLRAC